MAHIPVKIVHKSVNHSECLYPYTLKVFVDFEKELAYCYTLVTSNFSCKLRFIVYIPNLQSSFRSLILQNDIISF